MLLPDINQESFFSSPNDLVTAVLGSPQPAKGADPVTPPPPPPDEPKFGDVPASAFNTALPLATEGLVTRIEDIKSLHEQAQKATALATRISELESTQANAFKPASPFVEKLNSLVASGADSARIAAYWSLANSDLDAMSPLDIISFSTKLEHPTLSDAEVKDYVLAKYGLDGDEIDINSLPAAKMAQLKIESSQAKAKLETERVRLETITPQMPSDDNSGAMRKVQGEASATFWNEVLTGIPVQPKFSFEDSEKGIPKYEFNFNPRPEVLAAARESVLNYVRENPDAYPKTQDGAKAISEAVNTLVMSHSTQDFMRAMFLDMHNSMLQEFATRNAGPIPDRSDAARAAPPKQQTESLVQKVLGNRQ